MAQHVVCFLDTNFFMHYQVPSQIDWLRALDAKSVSLVIAPVVFRELDKHKTSHENRKLRHRAAERAVWIDKTLDNASVAAIRSNVTLELALSEGPEEIFSKHRLDTRQPDDQLLVSVLGCLESIPDARVMLVTADTLMRHKAVATGIDVLRPDASWKIPDESDPNEQLIKELQREIADLKRVRPELSLRFSNGEMFDAFTPAGPLIPEARDEGEELRRLYAEHPHLNDGTLGSDESVNYLTGRLLGRMNKTVSEYNVELNEYYARYLSHRREFALFHTRMRCTMPLRLNLRNDGTVPAEDIVVELAIPAVGSILGKDQLPKEPKPPVAPSKPVPMAQIALREVAPVFRLRDMNYPHLLPDVPNLTIQRQENHFQASVSIKTLMHNFSVDLPPIYLIFPSYDVAESFSFVATIHERHLPQPRALSLSVKVTRP